MKSIIDEFLKAGKENVRKYHLTIEGWTIVLIEDCREYYWQLHGETPGSTVLFSKQKLTRETAEKGKIKESRVCTVNSITRKIYKTDRHIMIAVNDGAGWGKFLLFENSKEISSPKIEIN